MAIKKGAFELYTQERKLPEKGQKPHIKTRHFFDDVYKEINGSQSVHTTELEDKLDSANISANDSKSVTLNDNELEIGPQSVHNRFANLTINTRSEIDTDILNIDEFGSQSVHNRSTYNRKINSEAAKDTNKSQSTLSNAQKPKPSISFSRLVGNQRDIIIALYKNMKINKSETTEELTLEKIADLTGVNPKSLKNTLFRLTSGGFLSRAEQKSGRGGWVKYRIDDQIINDIKEKAFL